MNFARQTLLAVFARKSSSSTRLYSKYEMASIPVELLRNGAFSYHDSLLILHRHFLRLVPIFTPSKLIRVTCKQYIRERFKEDYNARLARSGMTKISETKIVQKVLNTLIFTHNSCCVRERATIDEYLFLKNLILCWYKKEEYLSSLRNKNLKGQAMYEESVVRFNESMDMII